LTLITSTVSFAETISVAIDDSVTLPAGEGSHSIPVLENDSVIDGGLLMVTEITQGALGAVSIDEGGTSLSYLLTSESCGQDSFTYTIADGLGGTDSATVEIEISCPEEVVDEPATTTTAPDETNTTTSAPDGTTTTTAATQAGTTTTVQPTTTTTAPAPLDLSTAAHLIVKLVAGLSLEEQAEVITSHGGVESSVIGVLRLHMVAVAPDTVDDSVAAFASDPAVLSVDLDLPRAAEGVPNDPDYADQWALPLIGWDDVYGVVAPAGSSTIAVLDTGVDADTPDLAGRVVGGWSFDGVDPASDASGHGTSVATIAAARVDDGKGIAGVGYAGVSIMPVRVLGDDGTGQDSDIIEGLVWAVDHGADVVVMAFSNPGESAALQVAVDYAWARGVVLVAAAGNDGGSAPTYPAGLAKVVGVGATTSTDAVWAGSNRSNAVFMVAPGVGIASSVGTVTGTSSSAAMVAGAAAVMQAHESSVSPSVIVGRLARNAEAVEGAAGNGRLHLGRALVDDSTDGVIPAGAPGGGPFVGPYIAALTRNMALTFAGTGGGSVTITASAGQTVNAPVTCGGSGTAQTSQTVTSTCSPNITFNAPGATSPSATFTAAPDGSSTFGGWSGQVNMGLGNTCLALVNPCASGLMGPGPAMTVTFDDTRATAISVDCPATVAINQGSVCVVTVTDVDSGTKSNPAGTVEFSSDQTGNFSSSSCTLAPLVSDPDSSSCQVGYRPTADAGTHTITGDYQGSAVHEASSDDFDLTVTERSTSTVVDCDSPVAIDEASTCLVTVTDTDSGSKSDPSGSVDFSSSNPGGSFDFTSCSLVSDGVAGTFTSSCSVDYTGDAAQTDTITAEYNEASSALHASSSDTDLVVVTLRDTTTSVDCSPATVAINQGSVCVVTVTDVDRGSASPPSGDVHFSRNASLSATGSTGTFDSGSCTLVDNLDGESSSCSVEYTPTSVAGDHVIDAAYQGSTLHEVSNDSFSIEAELRPSSTTIDCDPEVVALGSPSTCTVTVTDVEGAGTKSSPTGNVSFATSGSGTFTPGQCALLPNPDGESSSCSVLYASTVASVDTIRADYQGSDVHAPSSGTFQYVVTYDPNGGFVTGGGWINSPAGASTLFPTATGRANFGFVSKYQKGASVPTGNTEFQFHAGNLNFKSTVYEWLVISGGHRAQYKGSGTINGSGNYGFILTAIDEDRRNPGQPDRFRIRIWNKATGAVVYDNQIGTGDDVDLTASGTLVQGSIVIHVPKK
jgi:subtilisin family serine protease